MYSNLFSPIRINGCEIKNRIVYPSLGVLYSYDGKINDRYRAYFARRAEGGAGIVTVGPVAIDEVAAGPIVLHLHKDNLVPDFKILASEIRQKGARAWVQLFHAGAYAFPFLLSGKQPIAPSAVFSNYSKTTPREMTKEDIFRVQDSFAKAAMRAKEAGFDGVEIIASAGYLLCQFLSPRTNKRTDEYGGSLENRLRFPVETIKKVREAVGPGFPVTIRMAGNDFVPGSNTSKETPIIAAAYQEAGVNAISVTGGWHEARLPQLPRELPRTGFAYLAKEIKQAVSVPVMASNRIARPKDAEHIIADGMADMVCLGRVLIADPDWPKKAAAGRDDLIRPCVACNQGCTDHIFSGKPVECIGNPEAGYETQRRITPARAPRKIMVVGAGPAGLEAAVTSARIGHLVDLYEEKEDIGGQLHIAAAPPGKGELMEFTRYYRAMLKETGVKLHTGVRVDVETIRKQSPDYLILATGASPLIPPIPGVDAPCVVTAWDVLSRNAWPGKNVAVIGGGAVGLETALLLASKGTLSPEAATFLLEYEAEPPERIRELLFAGTVNVTVFEMLDKAGFDIGKSTRWVLMDRLTRLGVDIRTSTKVTAIEKDGTILVDASGNPAKLKFDTIVIAAGSQPENRLQKEVSGLGIPYIAIGDSNVPARLDAAIHNGYLAACAIDDMLEGTGNTS